MSNISERSLQNDSPSTTTGGMMGANAGNQSAKAHRQWQAALNLLWAAGHLGHNASDSPITALQNLNSGGARDSAFRTETLGPSQSGGMSTTYSSGEGGAVAAAQQRKNGSTGGNKGPTNLAEFLRTVPHFYLLTPAQLQHLVDFALRRDFIPGEVVLEDGVEVTHVRVVLAGVIDVVDRTHGTVGQMESCSVFSLDSIIKRNLRSASSALALALSCCFPPLKSSAFSPRILLSANPSAAKCQVRWDASERSRNSPVSCSATMP